MNKFRKKPVEIEAVQFTEEMRDANIFDGGPLPEGVLRGSAAYHRRRREVYHANYHIQTLEGEMQVAVGDWIITGVKGERYPCKPDIFEATYEHATGNPASPAPVAAITDMSARLRETADQQPGWRPLLTAAADEIERYYGGMMNWKRTAEAKDADIISLRAALAAAAPQAQAEPVACLIRNRKLITPAHLAANRQDHFSDWGEWEPTSLAHGRAVTDPTRNSGCEYCWQMMPLYVLTAPAAPAAPSQDAPTPDQLNAALLRATEELPYDYSISVTAEYGLAYVSWAFSYGSINVMDTEDASLVENVADALVEIAKHATSPAAGAADAEG
jgi:hypothetical protein